MRVYADQPPQGVSPFLSVPPSLRQVGARLESSLIRCHTAWPEVAEGGCATVRCTVARTCVPTSCAGKKLVVGWLWRRAAKPFRAWVRILQDQFWSQRAKIR